uniref:TPM domain-containing protein n=1 Tax=Parascaris univalens TaxID=6257 RepID=A0A914ZUV9_PARUN
MMSSLFFGFFATMPQSNSELIDALISVILLVIIRIKRAERGNKRGGVEGSGEKQAFSFQRGTGFMLRKKLAFT